MSLPDNLPCILRDCGYAYEVTHPQRVNNLGGACDEGYDAGHFGGVCKGNLAWLDKSISDAMPVARKPCQQETDQRSPLNGKLSINSGIG